MTNPKCTKHTHCYDACKSCGHCDTNFPKKCPCKQCECAIWRGMEN